MAHQYLSGCQTIVSALTIRLAIDLVFCDRFYYIVLLSSFHPIPKYATTRIFAFMKFFAPIVLHILFERIYKF